VNFVSIVFAIANEVGVQFRMFFAKFHRLFQAHHHECSGIGIGCGAVGCYYCGREDVVLYWLTDAGIDGMGVSFAILIVELNKFKRGKCREKRKDNN
jgi:hypothetical protein